MRKIAFLSAVAFALNFWTVGAWAQSAASKLSAPKTEAEVNVLGSDANYRRIIAGSMKPEMLSNDINAKRSAVVIDSAGRPLPESVRMSAHVDLASKTAGLEQAKSPGQINSVAFGTLKALSVKTDLNRL